VAIFVFSFFFLPQKKSALFNFFFCFFFFERVPRISGKNAGRAEKRGGSGHMNKKKNQNPKLKTQQQRCFSRMETMFAQPGSQIKSLKKDLWVFCSGEMDAADNFHAATTLCKMYALEPEPSFLSKAHTYVERAIELFAENPLHYVCKAEVLLLKGDVVAAQQAMNQARTLGASVIAADPCVGAGGVFISELKRVQNLLTKAGAEQKECPIKTAKSLMQRFLSTNELHDALESAQSAKQHPEHHVVLSSVYAMLALHMSRLSAKHLALIPQ
jgi:hypothetical protein